MDSTLELFGRVSPSLYKSFFLLIIFRRFIWLATGGLAVFTMLAAVMAHSFWNMTGLARFENMNVFLEHCDLVGGLMMTALIAEYSKQGNYL